MDTIIAAATQPAQQRTTKAALHPDGTLYISLETPHTILNTFLTPEEARPIFDAFAQYFATNQRSTPLPPSDSPVAPNLITTYLHLLTLRNALELNNDDCSALYDDTCEELREMAFQIAADFVKHTRPEAFDTAVNVSNI